MDFNITLDFIYKYWNNLIIVITFILLFKQLRDNTIAINLTKETIKRDTQIRELELMPKTHFIIHSQVMIDKYIKEIKEIINILEKINKSPDNNKLIDEISKFYIDAKWLVIKHDNKPKWLDEIELYATQYYYNLISCMNSFKKWNPVFNKTFSESMIIRANESKYYIEILFNDYIRNMIPEVILNCPDSIKDSDFYR